MPNPPIAARYYFVGCGKAKATAPTSAKDLYVGSLFRARRAYVERFDRPWFIVSAKLGLVLPNEVIAPYERKMAELATIDRLAWPLAVVHSFLDRLIEPLDPRSITIEIHAGAEYADPLADVLGVLGINNSRPVRGLGQGEQMAWYRSKLNAMVTL